MAMPSIELVPDAAGRAAVRAQWTALHEAGLPSQADHAGASNEVHLSVVSAPELPPECLDVAAVRLGRRLPIRASLAGWTTLGPGPHVLAHAVALDDADLRMLLAVRAQVPEPRPPRWIGHVTLARRLDADQLARAVAVVQAAPAVEELVFTELRHWDPATARLTTLARG